LKEGGEIKTMTKQRALIKRLVTNALNGNAAAIKLVTSIMGSLPVKIDSVDDELSAEDARILKDYVERKIQYGK